MSLERKSGRFQIGTATGDVPVSGVGFHPEAVILQLTQVTALDTYTTGVSRCIGFLTERGGAKQVRAVAEQMENAQGTADTDHAHRTDACLIHLSIAGAIDGVAGAPAGAMFNSDGFTINVSDAFPGNYWVEYLALGGSDISDAYVDHKEYDGGTYTGDWTLPSGFGQPDFMFLMSTGSGLDAASTVDVHAKLAFGVAKSATERACMYHVDMNAATSMEGGVFMAARAFAGGRSTAGATHEFELDLQSQANWPTDGIEFTASLAGSASQNDTVIFGLFLRGTFQSKIALADSPTSNTTQDLDAGFVPKVAGFMSLGRAASASLQATDADGFSLGWFDGSSQVAVTHSDNDGHTTSTTRVIHDDGRCIVMESANNGANPTLLGTAVASYPAGNTVRLTWTNKDGTARQFAWFALGDAPATGQTVAITQASETNTAQAFGKAKRKAITQASETDSSQPIGRRKTRALSQAAETDSAQPLGKAKRKTLGTAVDTQTAQGIGKVRAIAAAQETESALAMTVRKSITLVQAAETSTAQALGRLKRTAFALASEAETAGAIETAKRLLLGAATETDEAGLITSDNSKVVALGQAAETDAAQPLGHAKRKALAGASEADAAQPLGRRKTQALGQASEQDSGQPLGRAKRLALGQAQDANSAAALAVVKLTHVIGAVETDSAGNFISASDARPARTSRTAVTLRGAMSSARLSAGRTYATTRRRDTHA